MLRVERGILLTLYVVWPILCVHMQSVVVCCVRLCGMCCSVTCVQASATDRPGDQEDPVHPSSQQQREGGHYEGEVHGNHETCENHTHMGTTPT